MFHRAVYNTNDINSLLNFPETNKGAVVSSHGSGRCVSKPSIYLLCAKYYCGDVGGSGT
jgi:hypothetical protein